jgi:predicted HTH transcriptional regulator
MPTSRDVFENPLAHWGFITTPKDSDFEGQQFDRKEAARPGPDGNVSHSALSAFRKEDVAPTVSAFANSNHSGGLLAIGVSKAGEVKGLSHLSDAQRVALVNLDQLLLHHDALVKLVDCENDAGQDDSICLVYVPHQQAAICETISQPRRAWKRQGPQNLLLTDHQRDQLRRDKRIVEFEHRQCTVYAASDLEAGVVGEYRRSRLADAQFQRTDDELLYEAGATIRSTGGTAFTNAGFLFFAANPQRLLPVSYIRLLRFDANYADRDQSRLPTFDKNFTGSLTQQIRAFRTFILDTAFFKTYQRRNPTGGFSEEPELPYIAVDEAVVNAVAHRDYAIQLPIMCEKYDDAFVVVSPGRVLQHEEVPAEFSLDNRRLEHLPRNPLLLEWLKSIRDAHGAAFVRALSEGTRRMRDAMAALGLPAPMYSVTDTRTTVVLYSNAASRAAALRTAPDDVPTEFANLYPLRFSSGESGTREQSDQRRRDILQALGAKLEVSGWYIDKSTFGALVAHRRRTATPLQPHVADYLSLFPAYSFQLREYWGRTYLVVDYTLTVQSTLTANDLVSIIEAARLVDLTAAARWRGWQRGKLLEVNAEWCRVYLFDYNTVEPIPSNQVIPKLPRGLLAEVLRAKGVQFDLAREIRRQSLSLQPNAARERAERTQNTVSDLAAHIFPLAIGNSSVELVPIPLSLSIRGNGRTALKVEMLSEPEVAFNLQRFTSDIREGITKFGSYEFSPHDVELVPVCSPEMRDQMGALIERLRGGKFKYRGAERTFSTRLLYSTIVTAGMEDIPAECRRLLEHHPEWVGNEHLNRLFLVYSPEHGYSLDDESSPYYVCKRILFEAGLPCQMVDTPTLRNPDFKDLNLALNIAAKTGVAPWVLPESIPDADFFIGLSYTQSRRAERERVMGFANVFNDYGRWLFYSGSGEAFLYADRAAHYQKLIENTLSRLKLPEDPTICFHYSARFSRDDRQTILQAARRVLPRGKFVFVWINTDHNVRLYDSRPEGDGSLARGSYVLAGSNQLYLSTTGFNPYRKAFGTPHALEVNVHTEPREGSPRADPDLRSLAAQVLSLTKLNWASTDSLSAEPITTKYAGDIAYLTAAFMRQGQPFKLHPVLEKTPWFI